MRKSVRVSRSAAERLDSETESGPERGAGDTPAPALAPGTHVDHFRVMRALGRGGMGDVHLARDTRLGRRVALKLIRPRCGGGDVAHRLLQEARTTARFNHPHIVTVYEVGEHAGWPYLALEYLAGDNLRVRARAAPLGLGETLRVGQAVALALAEAHRHGVLHRDLKPENVVIPRDGRPRVVDFGLALEVGEGVEEGAEAEGTPAYMAPERWTRGHCTEGADVWALGVMLYELVAGERPFRADDVDGLALDICTAEPIGLQDRVPSTPPALDRLVARCLQRDPASRPTAAEVAEALGALLAATAKGALVDGEGPFRGLLPFTEAHADRYFGREPDVDAFVERARYLPVLPVVGPSGVGKSSFVQAGVIPRMREQGYGVVLVLRPTRRPFQVLASRLLQHAPATTTATSSRAPTSSSIQSGATPPGRTGAPSGPEPSHPVRTVEAPTDLAERLEQRPGLLGLELRRIAASADARVLLFVDQLEELFTHVEDASTRRAFLDAICSAADDGADPIRIVFTIRDDFLCRLAGPEAHHAMAHVTLLGALDASALQRVVEQPLVQIGWAYDDPELAVEMVAAVAGERACLPLLQFTGALLWERRDRAARQLRRADYERIGGVTGALARHADQVVESLGEQERALTRRLLTRLVTADRTRQALPMREALDDLGEGELGSRLLGRLTLARLITVAMPPAEQPGAPAPSLGMVELAHESLIDGWATLSGWIDEDREDLARIRDVEQAAVLWSKRGCLDDDLWQGAALADAVRLLDGRSALPSTAHAFLEAARARQRRSAVRRRWLLGGAVAALLAITLGVVTVAWFVGLKEQDARAQRARAESQRAAAEARQAEVLMESAYAAFESADPAQARAKLRLSLEARDSVRARALWWRLRDHGLTMRARLPIVAYDLAYSSRGDEIAAAVGDGVVYLIDARTGAMRPLRGHTDQVLSVAISSDGRWVASGSWDGRVLLWERSTGKIERTLEGHTDGVHDLAFSPDATLLATASFDGSARLWRVASGATEHRLEVDSVGVLSVAFHPSGSLLATGAGSDGVVSLWEVDRGALVRTVARHGGGVWDLAFSPDGERLASAGGDGVARISRIDGGKQEVLTGHADGLYAVAFSPDGRRLATASRDHTARLWDATSLSTLRTYRGYAAAVRTLAFSPDGQRLSVGGYDGWVDVWDTRARDSARRRRGHDDTVDAAAFSPDGEVIASAGSDGTVRLWALASGRETASLRGDGRAVRSLAYGPGHRLMSGDDRGSLRLWDTRTLQSLAVLAGHTDRVLGLSFVLPDRLLSAGADRTIRTWDLGLRDGLARARVSGNVAAFAPHGEGGAVAVVDRDVMILDGNLEERARWTAPTRVTAVADRGGGRLIFGTLEGEIGTWAVGSSVGQVIARQPGRVLHLELARGGDEVATASSDGAARVWSLEGDTAALRATLRGHRGEVNKVRYSPDASLVLTVSDDGTVRLWDARTGAPRWRAPALLADPPRLVSHRGVEPLSATSPDARGPRLGPALETTLADRARHADVAVDVACVHTLDGALERWDVASDRLTASEPPTGTPRGVLRAFSGGCAQATEEGLVVLDDGAPSRLPVADASTVFAVDVDAGGWRAVVAAAGELRSVDRAGRQHRVLAEAAGVSMIEVVERDERGTGLLVGYTDGRVDQRSSEGELRGSPLVGAPSSAALRATLGPQGTLIVGYANGAIQMWDAEGVSLAGEKLHGAVVHMLTAGTTLHAATDLGDALSWDLEIFHRDRCELLDEVWENVEVLWRRGRAEVAASGPHPCRSGPGR